MSSEPQAITRLKRGDISGLETLVEAHELQAVRTAYLITGDAALAEDVAQSAFLHAYEHIDQFDSSRRFAPWFLRIVGTLALKALRRQASTWSIVYDEALPADTPIPPEVIEAAETLDSLRAALAALPPEQRTVIVLRYYGGLKSSEIAASLQVPDATVRWRLHAARNRLRDLLTGSAFSK